MPGPTRFPCGRRRYWLGLALVAETARRFGGRVDVVSDRPGSRFTLTLPAVKPG